MYLCLWCVATPARATFAHTCTFLKENEFRKAQLYSLTHPARGTCCAVPRQATAAEEERREDVAEPDDELSPVSPLANTRGAVQRLATGSGRALAHRSLSLCNVLLLEGEEPEGE